MNKPTWNILQGKAVRVERVVMDCDNHFTLSMNCSVHNFPLTIIFRNVSNLSFQGISFPFDINGFEIIDNGEKGWENTVRYMIHDFEDGIICFYCEKIDMNITDPLSKVVT